MTRKWLYLAPILLLAACSRNNNPPAAAQAATAASPTTTASAPAPVGYAAAPASPANPEPVAPSEPAESEPAAPVVDAPNRAPAREVIPRGTPVHVRLDETVDTRHNRSGDVIHATLSRPVVVEGRTVVPAGTRFTGHVTVAGRSGRLKGRAYIGVALDSFRLHGRNYRVVTTSVERASAAHKKRNGILIGGASGLGAALGAIAGGAKGALIGAGAGAAAGTAGAAATGKLNVAIPAEAPLRFTLRTAVPV